MRTTTGTTHTGGISPPFSFRSLAGLAAWMGVCFVAAAMGAVASRDAPRFYATLTLPSWAPPAGVFGPVWTVLYASMTVAAWQVWRRGGIRRQRRALVLFVLQLVVNALWSCWFFGLHQGLWAFADIVLLWVLVVATAIAFWRIYRPAGMLLIPYLAWISFAAALNHAAWRLNPSLLG